MENRQENYVHDNEQGLAIMDHQTTNEEQEWTNNSHCHHQQQEQPREEEEQQHDDDDTNNMTELATMKRQAQSLASTIMGSEADDGEADETARNLKAAAASRTSAGIEKDGARVLRVQRIRGKRDAKEDELDKSNMEEDLKMAKTKTTRDQEDAKDCHKDTCIGRYGQDNDAEKETKPGAFRVRGLGVADRSDIYQSSSSSSDFVVADDGVDNHNGLALKESGDFQCQRSSLSFLTDTVVEASQVIDNPSEIMAFAKEYHPDSKPPWYRHRRIHLYGVFLISVVVGYLVVLLSFRFILGPNEKEDQAVPTPPTTLAPTTYRESVGIQEQVELFIPTEKLYDPMSPHYYALQWILHEDPRQLEADHPLLIQRYVLVFLYFATTQNGNKPWTSCNPPTPNTAEDEVCWVEDKFGVSAPHRRWLIEAHECLWSGLECTSLNQTTSINLYSQGLTGTLPCDLSLLPLLQDIIVNDNFLTGTLCHEYGTLKHMRLLDLRSNDWTGSIPTNWWSLPNLYRLDVENNHLTGSIPTQIGQLSNLVMLFLGGNLLTGTLPTEVGLLHKMFRFNVEENLLHGKVPQEIGKVANLQVFSLNGNNQITGTLPSSITTLPGVWDLHLHSTSLSGEIPSGLWKLDEMQSLDISKTELSGTIGTEIGHMSHLSYLHLHSAELYGTIPTEMGLLTRLEAVTLQGNNFSGSIPFQFCELRGPYGIQELKADCSPLESMGEPAIACQAGCCTSCCEADTGLCLDQ